MSAGRGPIFLLGSLVAFGPLAIDLYLPALPAIGAGLGASAASVQASVSVFLAGFSLGMLFYGPLSDHFGRRPVLLSGIALFIVASVACALVQSVDQLVLARFLQALGGGAASVLARAVARDIYEPGEAVRQLSLMAIITTIAPMVAPLLGSVLLAGFGWRSTFVALFIWGLLALAWVWRSLPESLPPERRGQLGLGRAFAAYLDLLTNAGALKLLLTGGAGFASMFAYITAGPYFFIEQRGLTPGQYSLLFGVNAFGIILANALNRHFVGTVGPERMAKSGALVMLIGSLIVLGSIWQGAATGVILFGLFLAVSMTGLLGANCVGMLMTRYPQNAGAAAALFGAAQFGLGMVASVAVNLPSTMPGLALAVILVVCCMLSAAAARLLPRP